MSASGYGGPDRFLGYSREALAARAARLYYDFGLTHQRVADILGLSRVKVTRLIRHAHEIGLVRIVVNGDETPFMELEDALRVKYGLMEVIVVPAASEEGTGELRSLLALGTAAYMLRVLQSGMIAAVGLSRTIGEAARRVVGMVESQRSVTFVSLVGSVRDRDGAGGSPYEAAGLLAQAFGGTVEHLLAPVIVRSSTVAGELKRDPAIARALKLAASADVLFAGVGGQGDRLDFHSQGYVAKAEWEKLVSAGMVGDMCARFFGRDGRAIKHELSDRVIGLSLEELSAIPSRVIAAGGASKIDALQAALSGGLLTVLVTDASTARELLAR